MKLRAISFAFPIYVLTVILLLITFDVQAGSGQNAKSSVVGEWLVTATNWPDCYVGDKFKIVRVGSGYDVIPQPQTSKSPDKYVAVNLYHGTDYKIMASATYSHSDLVSMYRGTIVSASALERLAGKINARYLFAVLEDGNSAEYLVDKPRLSYYQNTSELTYEIVPYAYVTKLTRLSPTANKMQNRTAMAQVESRGEFFVLTKDGRKLIGKDINHITLEEGTKVITGTSGHLRMKLPDDTTFTIGPNSDIVIDSFVYDPDNTPRKVIANMSTGVFRWVTGKTRASQDPAEMKVKLPVMTVGIRGTDFESTVKPDGGGFVVLHFGQLELMENKTGFKFIMDAGYKVTFDADGSVSRPMKTE